jgi:UTP--glucose-1-phosphate uridylyltransferase
VSVTDAVIPVAGLGTRLLPATRSQPKEMLPVVDRPVVQYVVEELVRAGIARVLFVTGRRKRAIEDHFDADPELGEGPLLDPRTGLQLFYARQPHPAGLGDALRHAESFADGRGIVVALGDTIIERRPRPAPGIVERLIESFSASGAAATVAVEQVSDDDVSRYGIVISSGEDVERVVEKPGLGETDSRLAVAARYVLGPDVFGALREVQPDASGEVQVADALNRVIAAGGRVIAVPLAEGERRHDIGTTQSYCEVFLDHALTHPQYGPALRARAAALLDG